MPIKKTETETIEYTSEEKAAMAKEIKQRLYALVLRVKYFLVLSPSKRSLFLFVRKRLYGHL